MHNKINKNPFEIDKTKIIEIKGSKYSYSKIMSLFISVRNKDVKFSNIKIVIIINSINISKFTEQQKLNIKWEKFPLKLSQIIEIANNVPFSVLPRNLSTTVRCINKVQKECPHK